MFPRTEVKRNVQKFCVLTGKKCQIKVTVNFASGHIRTLERQIKIPWSLPFTSLFQKWFCLHVSFLAVLLHLLFQLLLLLRRPILLLTSFPASLPVRIQISLCNIRVSTGFIYSKLKPFQGYFKTLKTCVKRKMAYFKQ